MKRNLLTSLTRGSATIVAVLLLCFSSTIRAQVFSQPLFIPDTLSTVNHDTITLTASQTQRVFFPGATSAVLPGRPFSMGDTMPIMTYSYTNPTVTNPGILGPTLVWWKGDSVTMQVDNQLMETTTTHWHGAHVAPYNDGGPHQPIAPMTVWSRSFKIRDDATTMWYHPHLHMMTMMQVNMGMAGMIIVKDSNDVVGSQLPHTYKRDDFPIILQDKFFGQQSMMMDTIDTHCSMGTNFLVNGTWHPYLDVPAQMNRFRILNGSSERAYCLFLFDSTAMQYVAFDVIASDAGYLNTPYRMGTPPVIPGTLDSLLFIMSGERYEIVFDATGLQGHELYLINKRDAFAGSTQVLSFAGGPNLNDPGCYSNPCCDTGMLPTPAFDSQPIALMKIVVVAPNANPGILPSSLANNVIPSTGIDTIRVKTLYGFNPTPGPHIPPFSIDGINYNGGVLNDTIYLNDIEQWNVYNVSGVAHPFHIHDIHFFITEINGQAGNVPAYMKGPKDVAPVTDDSQFKLVMQFTDFATAIDTNMGYMYHCHILAHEDAGMMHQFVVTYPNGVGITETLPSGTTWTVYPNPNNGSVWVNPGEGEGVLHLYDVTGALIRTWNVADQSGTMQLDLNGVADGMYFLQLEKAGEKSVQKIQVMR
jgi:bilirubin oxidase